MCHILQPDWYVSVNMQDGLHCKQVANRKHYKFTSRFLSLVPRPEDNFLYPHVTIETIIYIYSVVASSWGYLDIQLNNASCGSIINFVTAHSQRSCCDWFN